MKKSAKSNFYFTLLVWPLLAILAIFIVAKAVNGAEDYFVKIYYLPNSNGTYLQVVEWNVAGCDIRVRYHLNSVIERENEECDHFEGADYKLVNAEDVHMDLENWYADSLQANGIRRIVIVYGSMIEKFYIPIAIY